MFSIMSFKEVCDDLLKLYKEKLENDKDYEEYLKEWEMFVSENDNILRKSFLKKIDQVFSSKDEVIIKNFIDKYTIEIAYEILKRDHVI